MLIDINELCSVCYDSTCKAINYDTCFEKINECPICRRCLIK